MKRTIDMTHPSGHRVDHEGGSGSAASINQAAEAMKRNAVSPQEEYNPITGEQINSVNVIKYGDTGEKVTNIQSRLIRLDNPKYALPIYGADGDFGGETLIAVNNFKKDKGIYNVGVWEGVVDGKTKNVLMQDSNNMFDDGSKDFKDAGVDTGPVKNPDKNYYLPMVGVTNDEVEILRIGIVNFGKDFIWRFNKNIIEPYGRAMYNTQPVFYAPETGATSVLMSKAESEMVAGMMVSYVISSAAEGAVKGYEKVQAGNKGTRKTDFYVKPIGWYKNGKANSNNTDLDLTNPEIFEVTNFINDINVEHTEVLMTTDVEGNYRGVYTYGAGDERISVEDLGEIEG